MNLFTKGLISVLALVLLPVAGSAQPVPDHFGAPDTLYAQIARLDDNTMTVTLSYVNDQDIVGLQIPLKLMAGENLLVADSAVFTGGRLAQAKWAELRFRPDTAIQCVTLGLMASISPNSVVLPPGRGRIATLYVSSLEQKMIENFTVDTTTTHPGLYLMAMTDIVMGKGADTARLSVQERQIIPQWVVKAAE